METPMANRQKSPAMALAREDRVLIEETIGRELSPPEAALFENLWSEHCAYRSSRALLRSFDSQGERVVIGPGDDAAVVSLTDEWYLTAGIESHNHPSYVDPYDGAATGVGGIVRDTLSMGAFPIALADCLYFGDFDAEESQYLLEGVVNGIADYGNAIGVPTVAGSLQFHEGYTGNPLVNVACVGLVHRDRFVTATAQAPGNRLVIVGNATGRDGLGGASFASEELAEDAETADRPAVQVGDPYTEKLLIEANEALLDAGVIQSARDLGAAGLGGASSELVAKGNLGADIELTALHQREPNMNATELLLAESQERMCYEVKPEDVSRVASLVERFDLGWADIGETTADKQYIARYDGEVVVDVPVDFLCEGAPLAELPTESSPTPPLDIPSFDLPTAIETVLSDPTAASKEWVYRQYDHEVGVRTSVRPGDDAAVLAIREADTGLAIAAGCESTWTAHSPREGAKAVALAVATNLAVKGATPIAAVDCINGGNPEHPTVYAGISDSIRGLAEGCRELGVPVVGGNVSLYNDSVSGSIPPTPTLAMIGEVDRYDPPGLGLTGEGTILLVGPFSNALGGSRLLHQLGGFDRFPDLPTDFGDVLETFRTIAGLDSTVATHDISHGGIAVTLAEMITEHAGASISIPASCATLVSEQPGRIIVETTDPAELRSVVGDQLPVARIGKSTHSDTLTLECDDASMTLTVTDIETHRSILDDTLS